LNCGSRCWRSQLETPLQKHQTQTQHNKPNKQTINQKRKSNEYERVIQRAEAFILERFVGRLPADFAPSPVVHIVKSEVDTESVGHILVRVRLAGFGWVGW
jgi:hypothetical protein